MSAAARWPDRFQSLHFELSIRAKPVQAAGETSSLQIPRTVTFFCYCSCCCSSCEGGKSSASLQNVFFFTSSLSASGLNFLLEPPPPQRGGPLCTPFMFSRHLPCGLVTTPAGHDSSPSALHPIDKWPSGVSLDSSRSPCARLFLGRVASRFFSLFFCKKKKKRFCLWQGSNNSWAAPLTWEIRPGSISTSPSLLKASYRVASVATFRILTWLKKKYNVFPSISIFWESTQGICTSVHTDLLRMAGVTSLLTSSPQLLDWLSPQVAALWRKQNYESVEFPHTIVNFYNYEQR